MTNGFLGSSGSSYSSQSKDLGFQNLANFNWVRNDVGGPAVAGGTSGSSQRPQTRDVIMERGGRRNYIGGEETGSRNDRSEARGSGSIEKLRPATKGRHVVIKEDFR